MDTVRNFTKRQLKNGPIMFLLSENYHGSFPAINRFSGMEPFWFKLYASLVPMDVWTTEILPWV